MRDGLQGRYYDPYSQKFLSEDPIGFSSGDFNLYRYTENTPLTRIDPHGTLSPGPAAAAVVLGIVIGAVVKCDRAKKDLRAQQAVDDCLAEKNEVLQNCSDGTITDQRFCESAQRRVCQ